MARCPGRCELGLEAFGFAPLVVFSFARGADARVSAEYEILALGLARGSAAIVCRAQGAQLGLG